MTSLGGRRTVLAVVAGALGLGLSDPATALMSGRAPDSPAARVDPNVPGSPWSSAVSVVVNGATFSGVVVAPRYVLTASHVVGAAQPAAVTVRINTHATPVSRAVTAIARFPTASFPYDDLALLTLESEVPGEVQIHQIHEQDITGPVTITLVGYGASGTGDTGPSVGAAPTVKRSGVNRVDGVTSTVDASGRTSAFYLFDFDGPSGNGAYGGASLGNALETGLASGDSGSPAFVQIDGQWRLLGINTLAAPAPGSTAVDYRFGTVCGGMRLGAAPFMNWLRTQTQGTLGPAPPHADVPLPAWAAVLMGVAVIPLLRQRRTASERLPTQPG